MKVALSHTKAATKFIRDKWATRQDNFALLDSSMAAPRPSSHKRHAQQFIQDLNKEAEQNRVSHPTKEDEQMSDEEDIKEQKIISMIQQNAASKPQR